MFKQFKQIEKNNYYEGCEQDTRSSVGARHHMITVIRRKPDRIEKLMNYNQNKWNLNQEEMIERYRELK
jgi:hypothetical protein